MPVKSPSDELLEAMKQVAAAIAHLDPVDRVAAMTSMTVATLSLMPAAHGKACCRFIQDSLQQWMQSLGDRVA